MKHVNLAVPHQPIGTLPVHAEDADKGKVHDKRTPTSASVPSASLRLQREVLEIVRQALATSDPQSTVRQRLVDVQAAQQARFAALPHSAREDDWIQLRHGELLRLNETLHCAALSVLRSLSSLDYSMPPVQ